MSGVITPDDLRRIADGIEMAKARAFNEKELAPPGSGSRAQILDFPGGIPGDVGIFLRW